MAESPAFSPCRVDDLVTYANPARDAKRSHYHHKDSLVIEYSATYGRRVLEVWVDSPELSGAKVCRVCGIAQPRYGRPKKVAAENPPIQARLEGFSNA